MFVHFLLLLLLVLLLLLLVLLLLLLLLLLVIVVVVSQVERFGEPTWRRLVEAVEDEVGGNNSALAQKIARQHPPSEA